MRPKRAGGGPSAAIIPALACLFAFLAGTTPWVNATEEAVTISGRLQLSADYALDRASVQGDPELNARLILDDRRTAWDLHAWIEGYWTWTDDDQQALAVKYFDRVYGNESRPLDLKELYGERRLAAIDWRLGLQRIAWGRLDEFPINDLFNPWDYDRFIVKPMEERKLGVPAVSATLGREEWSTQLVWAPWLVPYRLPDAGSRWAVTATELEPDLPARTLANGALGARVQRLGEIEGALTLFHGFDPRPVFGVRAGDNGLEPVPAFHRITSVGLDASAVVGPVSLRAEAAWTGNRTFNTRRELWPAPLPAAGNTDLTDGIEVRRDTLDYGIAADYRPFEDGLLTLQAQQTAICSRPDTLYEHARETLLWANLKVDWLNQKIETNLNLALNPEHAAGMLRAGIAYVFSDSWKTSLTALFFHGPPPSLFGRYAMNDQITWAVVYRW